MNTRQFAVVIGLIAAGLSIAAQGSPPQAGDLDIWHTSSHMIDGFDIEYRYETAPTPEFEKIAATMPVAPSRPMALMITNDILTKRRGTMRIVRDGSQSRFDFQEEEMPLGSVDWTIKSRRTEVFGDDRFAAYDALAHTGAVWLSWPDAPENIISAVVMPQISGFDVSPLAGSSGGYEFRSKTESVAYRYYLDAGSGMMPRKIEYFDLDPKTPPFLYRFKVITRYAQYNGVLLPSQATVCDMVYPATPQHPIVWFVEEHLTLTKAEVGKAIPKDTFNFTFPAGTLVHDRIAHIDYTVR
jgi:hypothetical protein